MKRCDIMRKNAVSNVLNFYKPYRKPSNSPIRINKNSSHSSNFLKQLLKSIEKSILETLPSEEIPNSSIKIFSKALKENDFIYDLKYSTNNAQQLENDEERKRKER